jgi:hypothetical protein
MHLRVSHSAILHRNRTWSTYVIFNIVQWHGLDFISSLQNFLSDISPGLNMLDSSLSSSEGRELVAVVYLLFCLLPLGSLLFCYNMCPMVVHTSKDGDPFGFFCLVSESAVRKFNLEYLRSTLQSPHSPRNVLVEFDFNLAIRYISRMWPQARVGFLFPL